jgi:hypothetical protein
MSRLYWRLAGIGVGFVDEVTVRMMKSLALYRLMPPKTAIHDQSGMPNILGRARAQDWRF